MLQLPARKHFLTLLLLMLAAASIWLFQGQPEKRQRVVRQNQNTPDAFMENFTTQVLGKQGRPRYQLQAARMAHYANDNRSELTQPQLTAFRPDGWRWVVVADTGRAENGSEQIFLNGDVLIQRFPDASATSNLQIRTRDVRVRPAEDYAETDQATTIVRGEGTLNAKGLQVSFRKGKLELLSQVRGTYVP